MEDSKRRSCWWLNPVAVVVCLHVPIIISAGLISEQTYVTSWGVPKYITAETVFLALATVLAFVLGYGVNVGVSGTKPRPSLRSIYLANPKRFRTFVRCSFVLAWLGAAIWFGSALLNGFSYATIVAFLVRESGASSALKKEYFETIPGLTTITQFGIAASILGYLMFRFERGRKRLERGKKKWPWALIWLLALNAIRAFLVSERIAFIETAVPLIVLATHFRVTEGRLTRRTRRLINLAPVLGIAVLFLFFAGFEMFRSWTYYSATHNSLLMFAFERLEGYYITAMNNSALILAKLDMPSRIPYFTQGWFWKMPLLKEALGNDAGVRYLSLLESAGKAEFNNPGGFLLPLKDFGTLGGLFYWFLFGFVVSKIYRSFLRKEALGLLLYPFFYVGLLELSRILYLSDGRAFPALVTLLFVAYTCNSIRRKSGLQSRSRRTSPPLIKPNPELAYYSK